MFDSLVTDPRAMLEALIAKSRLAGADAADAVLAGGPSISLALRMGRSDLLERSEGRTLGLRVLIGRRQAVVSTSDWRDKTLDDLIQQAVAMARAVPEDPFCGLAATEQLSAGPFPSLDAEDPEEPAAEVLLERAKVAEAAALEVAGVTNSEGGEAGWSRTVLWLAASNGFNAGYALTRHWVSVAAIAGTGTAMEVDGDHSTAVYANDLKDPALIGRTAGERAVRALGPRRVATCKVPVVFDPRVARGLVGQLAGALNGASVARGSSFLKDKMGQRVFAPGIQIIEDPFRVRGLRSRPFDGEGIRPSRRAIIADGVVTGWFLDLRSARQLGMQPTGNGSRASSPAASNLWLEPGPRTPAELIREVGTGLYVTRVMGHGANGVTGDYSQGVGGFWIEGGELSFPVSEITVAGNLKDMFLQLEPANDLEISHGIDAPTIRIDGLTVAGT